MQLIARTNRLDPTAFRPTVEGPTSGDHLTVDTLGAGVEYVRLCSPRKGLVLPGPAGLEGGCVDGPLVLIVDDDRGIRDFLIEALEFEGYRVLCAVNGREALRCLELYAPVVMLLDLHMPLIDGRGVLRALEARAKRPGVILMSAEYRFRDWCSESSADGCLTKPFSLFDMLNLIQHVQRIA